MAEAIAPAPRAAVAVASAAPGRLVGIDRLRGAVMILMALDHVREYFTEADFDPIDPARTTAGYFFTRWVTHLCAPVFMLLAGAAVALRERRTGRAGLPGWLARRGLFLIALELTVVHVGWTFNLSWPTLRLLVLWALGGSMVALAGLIALGLGSRSIGAIGALIVVGHNALDGIHGAGAWEIPWSMLHEPHGATLFGQTKIFVLYPVLPWIGVIALGYALGAWLAEGARPHGRAVALIGAAATLAFVAVRAINRYGDPTPWAPQARPLLTALSFMNVEKYPPSLDFVLATVGPSLLILLLLERTRGPLAIVLEVFGRVPLFFYVVHLYFIHLAWVLWQRPLPLWGVYAAWLLIVLALIAPCAAYGRLKKRRPDWGWLAYL